MLTMVRDVVNNSDYLLDPHTAIGVAAGRATRRSQATPMVCLATAHPAKFPEAALKAGQSSEPALPQHMTDLFEREERYHVINNDHSLVHSFIAANTRA